MKCHYCSTGIMKEIEGYIYKGKKLDNVKGWACNSCKEETFEVQAYDIFEQIDRAYDNLLWPQEIKDTRKSLKLTQQDIATELKIPRQTVIRWENGQAIQTQQNDANLRQLFEIHKNSVNEEKRVIAYLDNIYSNGKQPGTYRLAAHHQGEFNTQAADRIQKILKSKKL